MDLNNLRHLNRDFFVRDPLIVAEQLIGCLLIRQLPDVAEPLIVRINEVEAYKGAEDEASHAYRGVTARNRAMFAEPGRLYVYFTYGMHYCMNIVCHSEGTPGAILLRGGTAVHGIEIMKQNRQRTNSGNTSTKKSERDLLNGPAKLTQALAIDMRFNHCDLLQHHVLLHDANLSSSAHSETNGTLRIYLPHESSLSSKIKRTERIGISKAQHLPWRFVEENA
jgi:DNA-3-methyladenine glycosylase